MTAPAETEAVSPAPQSNADGQTDQQEGSGASDQADGYKPPREKRYREERNAAREALAAAQGQLQQLQTRELLRLAGEHLANPADLLGLGDVSLADLLDDDGAVSAEAVAKASAEILTTRPGLAKHPRVLAVDSTQGSGGTPGKPAASWTDLLTNR